MKKCFVICPIGDEGSEIRKQADDSMEFVIEPACKEKGYEAIRADKISDNGMITQSIIENILQADLAIVDLTSRNPNVFYELAIRHSHGLPAIQITRDDISKIPFDVHNVRTIQYDLSLGGAKRAREEIKKVIDSIESGNKPLNPVTSVSNILKLANEETPGENQVLSELLLKVNGIPDRLEQLENNISVRFSQMLAAFGESFKAGSHNNQPAALEDVMAQKFLETLMDNPEKGFNQMKNLMDVQKLLEDNGYIEKED